MLNTLASNINELCCIEPVFSLHLLARKEKRKDLSRIPKEKSSFFLVVLSFIIVVCMHNMHEHLCIHVTSVGVFCTLKIAVLCQSQVIGSYVQMWEYQL